MKTDKTKEQGDEIEVELPIGDFILSQKDISVIEGLDGNYYHYSDVCTLLNRLKSQSPQPQQQVSHISTTFCEGEDDIAFDFHSANQQQVRSEGGKLYRFVKASERLPVKEGWLFIRRSTGNPFTIYVVPHAIDKNVWIPESYEWLEEYSQPQPDKVGEAIKWCDTKSYIGIAKPYDKHSYMRLGWNEALAAMKQFLQSLQTKPDL